MTYEEFINGILEARGNTWFKLSERHHIVPRCLGGSDEESNLIYLTMKEHYIAHRLLVEENPENPKLIYALWRLSNGRLELTPEEYEFARIRYIESISGDNNPAKRPDVRIKLTGRPSGMLGKTHTLETKSRMSASHKLMSDETKMKMSDSHKGLRHRPESIEKMKSIEHTEDWNRKVSESLRGKPKSEEHKESLRNVVRTEEWRRKLSESCKGRVLSEETKRKIRESTKGMGKGRVCSEEVRNNMKEAFKNRVYRHICTICGVQFDSNSSRSKYCKDCKES